MCHGEEVDCAVDGCGTGRVVVGGEEAGSGAGNESHRAAIAVASEGIRELVAAVAGAAGGGVGDRAGDQSRNGASEAEKNGMTNRKIEYWVIPPEAAAEYVAHRE